MRGGVQVDLIPFKEEPHKSKTKSGGFLSFHTGRESSSYDGGSLSANEKMNLNLASVGRNSDFLFAAKTSIESVYTTTRIKNSLLADAKRTALRANV